MFFPAIMPGSSMMPVVQRFSARNRSAPRPEAETGVVGVWNRITIDSVNVHSRISSNMNPDCTGLGGRRLKPNASRFNRTSGFPILTETWRFGFRTWSNLQNSKVGHSSQRTLSSCGLRRKRFNLCTVFHPPTLTIYAERQFSRIPWSCRTLLRSMQIFPESMKVTLSMLAMTLRLRVGASPHLSTAHVSLTRLDNNRCLGDSIHSNLLW